jgi:hypothetical protein
MWIYGDQAVGDAFKDRELGEEAKYKLDEELKFKARCRRNKLVGRWAAERMGLTGERAAAYTRDLVGMALSSPAAEAVALRVSDDFAHRGVKADVAEIPAVVDRCHSEALSSLINDYPTALGSDHIRIGG